MKIDCPAKNCTSKKWNWNTNWGILGCSRGKRSWNSSHLLSTFKFKVWVMWRGVQLGEGKLFSFFKKSETSGLLQNFVFFNTVFCHASFEVQRCKKLLRGSVAASVGNERLACEWASRGQSLVYLGILLPQATEAVHSCPHSQAAMNWRLCV